MHLIVARVTTKPGHRDALLAALDTYIETVLKQEPGTQFFDIYQDALDPSANADQFVVLEGYKDEAAYQAHLIMPYRDEHLAVIRSHLTNGSAEQFAKVTP